MAHFDPKWEPSDWQHYYAQCVVRCPTNNKPMVVTDFTQKGMQLYDPTVPEKVIIPYTDFKWEHLKRERVGWVVKGNLVAYMARMPIRQQRKGLHKTNVSVFVHPWCSYAAGVGEVLSKLYVTSNPAWAFVDYYDRHKPITLSTAVSLLNDTGAFATCLANVQYLLSRTDDDSYEIWRGTSVIGRVSQEGDVLMKPGFEELGPRLENVDG